MIALTLLKNKGLQNTCLLSLFVQNGPKIDKKLKKVNFELLFELKTSH